MDVDPIEYRHNLSNAVAGADEFTLRESHKFVGWAEAAGK